jgi:hypothetical protein
MSRDFSRSAISPDASLRGWHALLVTGVVLLIVGGTDLALLLFPLKFGDLEWEFGTMSALYNGLPVPSMGAALILAGGLATERAGAVVAVLLWCVIMTVVLLGGSVLYLLNIPLALRSVAPEVERAPLYSAVAKACVAAAAYLALHCVLGYSAARFLRHK